MPRLAALLILLLHCKVVASGSAWKTATTPTTTTTTSSSWRSATTTTTTTTRTPPTEDKKQTTTPILPTPPPEKNETVLCTTPADDTFAYDEGSENEQAAKVMFHGIDWAEILQNGPSAIGQLGSLLLMSSANDFVLAKANATGTSQSLLESLILIGGEAFYAFFDAQTGIDNVIRSRFNTMTVSELIRNVVELHINGDQQNKSLLVRKDLQNIKQMADMNVDQVKKIVNSFEEVHPLIEKLTFASLEQQRIIAESSATKEEVEENLETLSQIVAQLQALGNYWNQTTTFFQSFSVMVEKKWRSKLDEFVDAVENVSRHEKHGNKSATGATKVAYDQMYKAAFQSTITDYRVNHLAETFVSISETFFLRMLGDVRTLACISGDSAAFMNSQQRLDAYVRAAPEQILRKLIEENDRFNKGIDDMRLKLDQKYNKLCGNKVTKKKGFRTRD